jgi:hypothetical protein
LVAVEAVGAIVVVAMKRQLLVLLRSFKALVCRVAYLLFPLRVSRSF